MPTTKPLLKRSELVDYQHAVAGHAGTLSDPDGLLFIKPCTQTEIDFYEAAHASHPALADLMPLYMGTLMLGEAEADAGATAPAPATPDNETWVPRGTQKILTDRAIVMRNTTHGYRRPNILDVKLGQRLWADDAPRQKRVRMDEVRAQTTHDKLGFRIAGMRVWGDAPAAELVPDSQGTMTTDDDGYRVYSKDFGRYTVDDGNVADALRQFLFSGDVDADHARALAQEFTRRLTHVCAVLEKERTRMFSASLLFVYEGDGASLRAAVAAGNAAAEEAEEAEEEEKAREQAQAAARRKETQEQEPPQKRQRRDGSAAPQLTETTTKTTQPPATTTTTTTTDDWPCRSRREPAGKTGDRSASRTDSGIALEEDDVDATNEDDDDEESIGYSGTDDDDDDFVDSLPPVCDVRLIDFAHAKFVGADEAPDENTLVGIRNLIRLFGEMAK